MKFNHIKEVKIYLKKLDDLIKPYKFYCIGETAISILDNKIPNLYFIISDIEISLIYKNFDEVNTIELFPYSFSFEYKEELFFLINIDKKISNKNIDLVLMYLENIIKKSLLIPLLYDPSSATFKNINKCFNFLNKEDKKYINGFYNRNSRENSRYFEFFQKYYKENIYKAYNGRQKSNNSNIKCNNKSKLNIYSKYRIDNKYGIDNYSVDYINNIDYINKKEDANKRGILGESSFYFNILLDKINKENDILKYRVSLLFMVFQSNESRFLIEEFSKTDFFISLFPLMGKCKMHYQTKEYHPEGTLYDHLILTAMEINSNDFALKLAAMLHDIGKVESISINPKANYPKYPNHANLSANIAKRYLKDILRFFPFYSQLLEKVTFLIENHMKIAFLPDLEEDKKKDILNSVYLNDLLKLLKADLNASSADLNIYKRVYSYIQKLKI